MDIQTTATDDGRIIALQVALSALVELIGRDNATLHKNLISFLERTGMDPVNTRSSAAFHELIQIIQAMEDRRE
ncbi:hypothetical protein [Rahnella victoriana]|uniref:hypothetical protein n=1 Tax=Rahnella victoriana TaxID=1510570 RepID=UPI000BB1A25B|nr:hypothetical protein [Rahnella victoriana]PBI78975.1 hypothetical protein A9993_04215 [Rahnella victoriana]TBX35823.1 hypothetical protein EYY67_06760 [Rahnella victoriana]